jgi:3',5'-nucleoside bisphosphate phosphatase
VNIDLHIHSTASDGTLSPGQILKLAKKLNLGAISITDHDTLAGSKEALNIGIPSPMKFLTGVEVSAAPPKSFSSDSGSLHILGYAIQLDDPVLNQTLKVLQASRENRNPRIIERLRSMGVDISLKEINDETGNGQVGRPHIARVMVKKGVAGSIQEAFDDYLAKGGPAYVDKFKIDSEEAVAVILGAKGIPVLAHPGLIQYNTNEELEDLVLALKSMGLKGIEVFYPEHSPSRTAYYKELARRYDLFMTGGSDFHGDLTPEVQLGIGKGELHIPFELYEALIAGTE